MIESRVHIRDVRDTVWWIGAMCTESRVVFPEGGMIFLVGSTCHVWSSLGSWSSATTCFWGGDPRHMDVEMVSTVEETCPVCVRGVDGAASGASIFDGEADEMCMV